MYFIPIVAVAVALDRLTKIWVISHMELDQTIPLLPGVFHITYIQNRGAAFSILSGKQGFLLIFTGLVMLGILICLIWKRRDLSPAAIVSLSLILAGGIGNIWDRGILGYVPDFFDFRLIHFAIFNVADIAITLGCLLLFLEVIILEPRRSKKESN